MPPVQIFHCQQNSTAPDGIASSLRERDIRRANLRRFLITSCSAALATKSEFSPSAITIDIHLLDPGVDRSMAEFEKCRLECSWILIGTSGGGGRDSESVQAS